MQKIIIGFLLILLIACGNSENLISTPEIQKNAFSSFGTLSDSDDVFQGYVSVVLTKLAHYRHKTAQLLRAKRISRDTAIRNLSFSDRLRDKIDEVLLTKNLLTIQLLDISVTREHKKLETVP